MADRRRVVILGHTGFVGRALTRRLLSRGGWDMVGFSTSNLDLRSPDNLGVLEASLDSQTVLVFLAALPPIRGNNLQTMFDNIRMADNVAQCLRKKPPRRVIYVSSDAVYGNPGPDDPPVTEETPVAPANYYAIAKFASERLLRIAADSISIPLLMLRPTGIFGPGDTNGAYGPNGFTVSLVRDRTIRLFGEGEELRDHVYIEDFVSIIDQLLRSDAVGVCNASTGESRSFAEIARELRSIVPFEFGVTSVPRRAPLGHRRYDIRRLREIYPGLQFTDFREALRATFQARMDIPSPSLAIVPEVAGEAKP